jgi:hypothetical protein
MKCLERLRRSRGSRLPHQRSPRGPLLPCCMLVLSSLLGCGPPPNPTPVPMQQRLPLSFSLSDLTGTHVDTILTVAMQRSLQLDYIYRVTMRRSTRSTESDVWELSLAPNPFRVASGAGEANLVKVHGDVERVEYGPERDLGGLIAGFAFFGFAGAALAAHSQEDTYVVAVQARIAVQAAGEDIPILIRVAHQLDVKATGRRQAVAAASKEAQGLVLMEIARELDKRGWLRFAPQIKEFQRLEDVKAAIDNLQAGSNNTH